MTPGEIRWIKKHTEKTFKELNIKGVNMKSNKKTVAHTKNPIVGKLLRLKYKINEAYRSYPHETNKADKSWVMNLISDVRKNNLTKLSKEDILHCNGLWRDYEGK
ncbi:MAG: hypothetical protein CMI75_01855 [Candidatus Pelagibacter sp.]|nr:hypothetical protein [Candidatus Pelagibacter sp.]OUT97039.1 MAG: hypothetical protein CBB96_00635 [Gammaproteobacteria bacterium TMED36]|tara:strand:+ start:2764 stop:3078 length:315 start_codon:yes stop_codon:yes gene_type:complete